MTTPVLPDNRILRCAVVDDEPLALSLMVSYVEKTPFLSLSGAYSSAVEALGALTAMQVDLVFLDIQMPELDGLDFSRMIDKSVKIVFTTAFDRYAIDGYKVNAVDYLLKPISYKDFLEAAGRVLERFPSPSAPVRSSFFVKSEYRYIQIYFDEILYIEGMKDYVLVADGDENCRIPAPFRGFYPHTPLFHSTERQNPRDREGRRNRQGGDFLR